MREGVRDEALYELEKIQIEKKSEIHNREGPKKVRNRRVSIRETFLRNFRIERFRT